MASSEPVNQPAPAAEASKTEAHPAPAGDATTTATKPVEDAAPTPEHQHAELDAAEAAGRATIIDDEAPARATVERAEHDGHHDLQFKQMHAELDAAEAAGRAAIVADEAHARATMERAEHDGHRDIQVAAEAAARSTIVTDEAEARTAMKRASEEAGFDAEAAALERELAELAEADPVVQNETESAEAEIKARDELLQTLQSKNDITSEREAKRQDTETQVLAIEARASSREGTIEAAETATALEELFEKARFANMWEVTVSADELATLVSAAPEDGLPPQEAVASLEADKKHHENEVARAEDIQAKGLAAKAERIAKNEALLTQLEQDIDADLRRLNGMKPRLRHALNEQRFHLKRGTHIKASTVARRAKDEFLSLEQAKAEHSKICESINEEDYQITAVTRELDALKREKNHLLKTSAVDKAALLSNIENLNKEVESVAWEQKTLEDENQAMRDMRRDMIRTAAQVRHQLRE